MKSIYKEYITKLNIQYIYKYIIRTRVGQSWGDIETSISSHGQCNLGDDLDGMNSPVWPERRFPCNLLPLMLCGMETRLGYDSKWAI